LEPRVVEPVLVRATVTKPIALPKPEIVSQTPPSSSLIATLSLHEIPDIEITVEHLRKRFHFR
jgi:hypothetical protein